MSALPLKTYRVLYVVVREEYYEVEAASAEEAQQRAFSDGRLVDQGETTDVSDGGVEKVRRKSNMRRPRGKRLRRWNHPRADWARTALDAFQAETGADDCDAPADLLCDLMHLADREGWPFHAAYSRAWFHYHAEQTEP